MKYNRSKVISSIIIVTMIFATTITFGPLNTIQTKSASAQTLNGSYPIIPSQGANMMPNNSTAISNPSSMTTISPNFTGSISTFSPIINGFKSSNNYTLSDAIPIAEDYIGNGSTIIDALTHPVKGFIVYDIIAIDPNDNAFKVTVDPDNGKILSVQQISITEIVNMLHSTEGIGNGMNNYDMINGSSYGMNKAIP